MVSGTKSSGQIGPGLLFFYPPELDIRSCRRMDRTAGGLPGPASNIPASGVFDTDLKWAVGFG
jgi:hypothetical protein